jgi:hypothetical protein
MIDESVDVAKRRGGRRRAIFSGGNRPCGQGRRRRGSGGYERGAGSVWRRRRSGCG